MPILPFELEASNDLSNANFPESITFERVNQKAGLSDNLVTSIVQDQYGFMWFGTENGLNRYDGYEFKVYYSDPEQTGTLSNNDIKCLLIDREGDLWIGTREGLNRFDLLSENVTCFLQNTNDPTALRNDFINNIYEDRQGRLWIATQEGGLHLFNRQTRTFTSYLHDADNPNSIGSDSVRCITEDDKGHLWIGLLNDGFLNRFDPESEQFTRYIVKAIDEQYPGSTGEEIPDVLDIHCDENGYIWLGTWALGLFRFDPSSETFKRYEYKKKEPNSLSSDIVMNIAQDPSGIFWFETRNGGVSLFDPKTEQFRTMSHDPGDSASLSSDTVLSFYEDRAGGIWLGTIDAGVCRYDPSENHFRHFEHNPKNDNSLSDSKVYALCTDTNGEIWIGTDGGGLNRFDPKTETFTHYTNDANDPKSLSSNTVISLLIDSKDNLWVGSWQGALSRFDRESESFVHYYKKENTPGKLQGDYFRALCEDQEGAIWIGTEHNGLNRYDPKTEQFTNYRPDESDPHSLSDVFIRALFVDRSGNLWIGTDNGGLNRYIPEEDHFEIFKEEPKRPDSLQGNFISSIFQDRRGYLWIGSDKGLQRLNPETMTFYQYTEKDGLANNVVKGILEDNNSNLWISTDHGISYYRFEEGTFRNFGLSDGLQDWSFTIGTCCKGSQGELYFGGLNGFNRIWPDQIRKNEIVPPIVITSIQVMGEPYPLAFLYEPNPTLQLNYWQNFITFEFAALNYTQSSKNQYKFRMLDIEPSWNESDSERSARYTTLAPGEYTFQVIGSNNDGVWNQKGTSVSVIIAPPFWQTAWFRVFVITGIFLLILLVHGIRVNTLKRHRQRLAEEVKRQTALLRDQSLELKEANARLEEMSFLDGLTGIPNRRRLEQHMEHEWKRARRESLPMSVVICDIDHFKKFNDTYGHQQGDLCLIRVARMIQNHVRRPGDLVARYGGEEFVIVLSNTTPKQAAYVSEKIRRAIYRMQLPHADGVKEKYVTVSFGIAGTVPTAETTPLMLIGVADRALYEAKEKGRNRVVVAENEWEKYPRENEELPEFRTL